MDKELHNFMCILTSNTKTKILLYIAKHPFSLQKEISSRLKITQSAVSQHLRSLEEEDYVRKRRNGWQLNHVRLDSNSGKLLKFTEKLKEQCNS